MAENLALHSVVSDAATLEIYLADVPVAPPADGEVVIRLAASPINPSDLRAIVGLADVTSARPATRGGRPSLILDASSAAMASMRGRIDVPLVAGHEGCGTVIEAGPGTEHLLGKLVAVNGGALHAKYATVAAKNCLPLPDGTDPVAGAACYVNPVTALAFVELLRRDGYGGMVHTAAASSLGQMLVKICAADGVPLVNIVRSDDQAQLLAAIGAEHVVNSGTATFRADLIDRIAATDAMLAFDAVGGGPLVGDILHAMEAAAARGAQGFSNYGTEAYKQVYIYGGLDIGPTSFSRRFGFAWSVSGFLLRHFLSKVGEDVLHRLQRRVVDELDTTFRTHYSAIIGLEDLLDRDTLIECNRKATNAKFLICPNERLG